MAIENAFRKIRNIKVSLVIGVCKHYAQNFIAHHGFRNLKPERKCRIVKAYAVGSSVIFYSSLRIYRTCKSYLCKSRIIAGKTYHGKETEQGR